MSQEKLTENKAAIREQLERDIAEFIDNGGEIEVVPPTHAKLLNPLEFPENRKRR